MDYEAAICALFIRLLSDANPDPLSGRYSAPQAMVHLLLAPSGFAFAG
jgi:hypothetical protein